MRVIFASFRRRKSKCAFDVIRFFIYCGGKCKLGQALHTPSDEERRRQFRRTIYRTVFYDYFIRKPFYPVRIFVYRRQKKQKKNTARRTALVVHTPAYRPYRFSFSRLFKKTHRSQNRRIFRRFAVFGFDADGRHDARPFDRLCV